MVVASREVTVGSRSGTRARWPRLGLASAMSRAFERRRLLVLLPFFAIAGIVAGLNLSLPWITVAIGGSGLALGLIACRNWPAVFRMLALLSAAMTGFALLAVHGQLFGTEMLRYPAYGSYEMTVDEVLSVQDSGLRIVVSGIEPGDGGRDLPVRRARVVVKTALELGPDDRIAAPVRFYSVPGPVLPNAFDAQLHGYFDGIGAYGATTGDTRLVRSGESAGPGRIVAGVRRAIAERLARHLDGPARGVAQALIIGDQSAIDEETRRIMSTAGLAHVLAVSGLHLTLVAGIVLVLLRGGLALLPALHGFVSIKQLAAAGAIIAALGYFAISGGSVAATRATIMLVLILGAVLAGRRAFTMRNVAIAALIVIVTDPVSVVRPSFQLSFAAVVALIGVWELVRPSPGGEKSSWGRLVGYLSGIVATSLVAGAATLLFSIYHFQQTAPLGSLGNLVALPLVGFVIMPMALVGTLLMPLGLEAPFLSVMGLAIDAMLQVARLVSQWSEGLESNPLLTPLALGVGLAGFAWFAFFEDWRRLLGPALAVPIILLVCLDRPPDVLIADTTQAVALRGEDGLDLVAGRGGFAVDVWRETYGEPIAPHDERLSCDSIACVGRAEAGFSLALIFDPAGFFEECGAVDLVISRRHAPSICRDGLVIDAGDLARHGVHWLRWDAGRHRFERRRAIEDLAHPWRVHQP